MRSALRDRTSPSLERIEVVPTQTRVLSPASSLALTSPTVRDWIDRSVVISLSVEESKSVASLASSLVTLFWSIGAVASFG